MDALIASAKGWHTLQLAVLGFIGFCGVMSSGAEAGPGWLENLAGILSVVALLLACLATYLVGRVAWPFYGKPLPTDAPTPSGSGALRAGIALTYLAVVAIVVVASSAWWPQEGGEDLVEVTDATGRSWCGTLAADAPAGTIQVGTVLIPAGVLATIRPVGECPS